MPYERRYRVIYWVLTIFCRIFYRCKGYGREHVPAGACILCGNHTSMADPIMVAMFMKNKNGYNRTKFMAKVELSKIPVISKLLSPFLIFVNRGKSDMGAIKATIEHAKAGGKVIIFPEGQRVDENEDVAAKTGVIMMAIKSEAPIVPVFISEGRKLPYFIKRVKVSFGEPYQVVRDKSVPTAEAYRLAVGELMTKIKKLGETLNDRKMRI